MSKYVKFTDYSDGIMDLTTGKPYLVNEAHESITDDNGDTISIMTPNWGLSCSHLDGNFWLWCDSVGNCLTNDN
ncbi:hypothetical protein NVP1246O_37 [Vibrio phage 1.246.O._10N.261.54.E10]|nr:hypothetical protein NVP1246O_37 [Vibrio phage 1.246.O._10N.261.54.E10]